MLPGKEGLPHVVEDHIVLVLRSIDRSAPA